MPNDRSQHKNKDQAMKQMKAKLYELEMQKKNAEKQAMEITNPTSAGAADSFLCRTPAFNAATGVETRNTQAVLDSLDQFIETS